MQRSLKETYYSQVERDHKEWNFLDELVKSLNSQVDVLFRACLSFLKLSFEFQIKLKSFLNQINDYFIHPFGNTTISISGYTFKVFKFYFLRDIPMHAVNFENTGGTVNVSKQELLFAAFKSFAEPHFEWQHAMNNPDGQKTFGKYHVDLYSPKLKQVLQYHGCQFHCHLPPECSINIGKSMTDTNKFNISFEDLKTKDDKVKCYLLQNHSDDVSSYEVKFECQWKKEQEDFEYQIFYLNGDVATYNRPTHRLIPRACVRGGLLDVYHLRWKKSLFEDEIFKYSDVNSLYPFCAINFPFPVGQYEIIIGEFVKNDITFTEGFHFYKSIKLTCGSAHVRVRPPANLKRPFLQYRILNKLSFLSLCVNCSLNKQKNCNHQSPVLESCWMLSDLNMAIKLGYQIIDWFEIHYYPKTDYILKSYSELLYSEKLKHSGWPEDVSLPDEKQAYCDLINSQMNLPETFKLTLSNVISNPAQRQLAKSLMNNLYGKFSEQIRTTVTEFVQSKEALERISTKNQIQSIIDVRENDLLQVEYDNLFLSSNKNTNIYIGAQINSYARCIMYDHMLSLENAGATIYSVDTDGLFYSIPKNSVDPLPYSNSCGHFKNMVENSEIISFFTLGPRNYSMLYKDKDEKIKSILKVKGLVKHSAMRELINHQVFEDFLDSSFESELKSIIIPQLKFCLDKKTKKFCHKFQNFSFRNKLYLKRFVLSDCMTSNPRIETFPFGYFKSQKRKAISSGLSSIAKKTKRSN